MSKLYVEEFPGAGRYQGSSVPVADTGVWTENANSPMTVAASATVSASFGTNTKLIRVHTDAICSIVISPTGANATANNARMAANQTEYYYVEAGHYISVITNS